jgi:hypothetical protein
MSTLPLATKLTRRQQIPADMDDQLVRRGIFDSIKHAVQKVGNTIKSGIKKVGNAVKTVVHKVGNAAKKTVHWMKTTGAPAIKFGLKAVSTAGRAASKVVQFVPGWGKPVSVALEAHSKVAGAISDKIPGKIPRKLRRASNVMDKANKIMDYIPRRRGFSEESEEAFQQRDIGETYHFEERDDFAFESRDESYFEAEERDIYERYDLD